MIISAEWTKKDRAIVILAIGIKAKKVTNIPRANGREFLAHIGQILISLTISHASFLEGNREMIFIMLGEEDLDEAFQTYNEHELEDPLTMTW